MIKHHHYLVLLMVGQALAQQYPATLPVVMPNLVVLFNGSCWTSYNNATQTSMSGCNTVLCPGENSTNLILSSFITFTGVAKISWKANTNSSSCDQSAVNAVVDTNGFPQSIGTATLSPASCSPTPAISLSGSFSRSAGFYFGLSLNSTAASCVSVSNVSVWYTYCNTTTIELAQYQGVNDGSMANGTCVTNANSSNVSLLQATCNGTTFQSPSSCTCNPGYMNVLNSSCESVPVTSSMFSLPLPSPTPVPVPSSSSPIQSSSPAPVPSSSSLMVLSSSQLITTSPSQMPPPPKSSPSSSILTPTTSLSPPPPDVTTSFPLAIAIGAAVGGGVLAILILLVIVIIVCVCRIQVNRQGFYETNEDKVTEPTMLRYSASLRSLTSQTVVPIDGRAPTKENEFYV